MGIFLCERDEEYIYKFQEYSPARIKDMMKSGLFQSEEELYQLILGKISRKEKILEEPLNKLKRDMVRDIYGEKVLGFVTEDIR